MAKLLSDGAVPGGKRHDGQGRGAGVVNEQVGHGVKLYHCIDHTKQ